ncbi:oxidoreductase [Brachybacterium endophyticum]|uniref:Oxidoreductase n=1 Tax=Brachybacterium endophyticum TaxID=2182385 RepID=A0A2U2RNB0_9MICO|nr:Gfo/Idh/MocA family oxidoreductase [Brachybacterium endophyticum]PWH07264.1 oxidoreductase [Brachybacterium endophyticum]
MTERRIGIIVNGASGRMGYRQHLVRSLLAIRDQGGVELADGTRLVPDLLLVGRNEEKLRTIAERHGLTEWTTDLDAALAAPGYEIYFDALVTNLRVANIRKAIAAGKAIYTEKPTAETLEDALALAREARDAGTVSGVVRDKLYLPGLLKLRRLVDSGFFGRVLSVRGEFGYWVFEGDGQSAQRPSWNYRSEDGGGIVADMFPHWNYVIENLFGRIQDVYAQTATHIPERWDEQHRRYTATADDAAYGVLRLEGGAIVQMNSSWDTRVHRDELVEFHVDGTRGSAVVGLWGARIQPREATPRPVWNPDVPDPHDYRADWQEVPDNAGPDGFDNAFKAQWEDFLAHWAEGRTYPYDLLAGARGVRLAEAALTSAAEGRRITLEPLTEA